MEDDLNIPKTAALLFVGLVVMIYADKYFFSQYLGYLPEALFAHLLMHLIYAVWVAVVAVKASRLFTTWRDKQAPDPSSPFGKKKKSTAKDVSNWLIRGPDGIHRPKDPRPPAA
jgi:hypothetical protein